MMNWNCRLGRAVSKRHEKAVNQKWLICALVGLEAIGFDLEASVMVACLVKSIDQNEVGKGLVGVKSIKVSPMMSVKVLPMTKGTVAKKELDISVCQIVCQHRALTLAVLSKNPEVKTH